MHIYTNMQLLSAFHSNANMMLRLHALFLKYR